MAVSIRRYTPDDRAALDSLHASHGTDFWYADPDDPVNFETWILEDDGKPVCAVTARYTAEAFLMVDKSYGTPRDRWAVINQMIEHMIQRAHELGLREVHIGVNAKQRGWLRKLLSIPSMILDGRFHVVLAVWQRFRGV